MDPPMSVPVKYVGALEILGKKKQKQKQKQKNRWALITLRLT